MLIRHGHHCILLHQPATGDLARLLLEHSADLNQVRTTDGVTPVYITAQNGHVDVVKVLLKHTAEPNQATTADGAIPVIVAAQEGHLDGVKLLLEHYADPNQATIDNRTTPLHASILGGELLAAKLLVVHSGNVAAAALSVTHTHLPLQLKTTSRFSLQHQPHRRRSFHGKIHCQLAKQQSGLCTMHRLGGSTARTSFTPELYHAKLKEAVFAVLVVEGRL